MKKLQLVLLTFLLGWAVMGTAASLHTAGKEIVMDEYDTVPKAFDSIKATLKEQGLEYIGVIDHATNAEEIGMSLPPTLTILFRDQRLENRLLPRNPMLAIDLPQKILLWEDLDSDEIKMLYNPVGYLAERHSITIQSEPDQKPRPFGRLGDGLITIDSAYSLEETVESLKGILENNDFYMPYTFSFAQKGNERKPAQLIIFENPEVDTPLIQKRQAIALDLPQKLLVWEDQESRVHVTYNDPKFFGKRHGQQGLGSILTHMSIQLEKLANEGAGNESASQSNQLYQFTSPIPVQPANTIELEPMQIFGPLFTPTITIDPFRHILNNAITGSTYIPGINTNSQSNANGHSTNTVSSSTAKTPEEIVAHYADRAQDKANKAAKDAQEESVEAQSEADEKKEELKQAELKEKQAKKELETATGRQRKRLQKGVDRAQKKLNKAQKKAHEYQNLADQAKKQAGDLQKRADKGTDRNIIQGIAQYAIDNGKDMSEAMRSGAELLRNPEMLSSYLQAIKETSKALQDPARRAEVIQLLKEALGEGLVGAVDNFAQDKDYYTGYIGMAIFDPLGKVGKLGKLFSGVRRINRIGGKNVFNIDSTQLGNKLGKHVEDFGGVPSSAADRQRVIDRVNDIANNPDKIVAGTFQGQGPNNTRGPVKFRIQGSDVVVTKPDGSFVTILKDGINNTSVKNALGGG